jgi:hypothetical protein
MQRLTNKIVYTAENTANGAQVRITTGNPEALAAVHEFLRFQIKHPRTSDPSEHYETPYFWARQQRF